MLAFIRWWLTHKVQHLLFWIAAGSAMLIAAVAATWMEKLISSWVEVDPGFQPYVLGGCFFLALAVAGYAFDRFYRWRVMRGQIAAD